MTTIICPNCSTQNGQHARFCIKCGLPLTASINSAPAPRSPAAQPPPPQSPPVQPSGAKPPAAPACPRCGSPLRSTARFCGSCGYDLLQVSSKPAPPAGVDGMPVMPPAVPPTPPQPVAPPPAAFTPFQPAAPPGVQSAGYPPGGFSGGGMPAGGMSLGGIPPAPQTQVLDDAPVGPKTLIIGWMGGNSQRYPLNKAVTNLGRAPDNDIVINHPAVSGHHLNLTVRPDGVLLTDLKSTNGTMVNGQRMPPGQPHMIQSADAIRIGDLTGNWVSLAIEGPPGEAIALRTLSLGKLDLTNQTNITIGRDPNSYLPLNHPAVSYRHAQITRQDGGLTIRDLGSTNGTYVNGKRISQGPLKSGDEIQIGPFKLVYDAQAMALQQSMRMGHRIDALRLGREVANKRFILTNVSMTVNPGEFVALVGGSGAGKSTLMKAMNGYEPANHGHLLLDGEPLYGKLELYRNQMGYVPQDDIIHRTLPVKVALYYAAKLRLPDLRPREIQERILDALRAVEMTEHADKPVRVLSGGQRKRVSIAAELLARPTLFFLDEPTSGLDPGLEKKMMFDLAKLADDGRTIILVTHATANIEQCDHVAFLSQGRLSYYGPPNDALTFFGVRDFSDIYLKLSQDVDPARGKEVPPELQAYYPPRDGKAGRVQAGVLWSEAYVRSTQFQQFVADRQKRLGNRAEAAEMARTAPPPRRSRDNFLRQTVILARRHFDLIRYDWKTLAILLLMVPLISMLFAGVSLKDDLTGRPGTKSQIQFDLENEVSTKIKEWEKLPSAGREKIDNYTEVNYTPVEGSQTLVTMLALALTQAGTFVAAYEIVKERAIFRRERAVNLSVIAYVLAKIVVLSLFAVVQVISALIIISMAVSFDFEGAVFPDAPMLEIFVTLYLATIASIIFGLFISALVPNTDVVLYAILVQLFVQIIMGGTLFPLDSKVASSATIAYWATDAFGSSVDIEALNQESMSCMAIDNIDSTTGVKKGYKPMCSPADTDLSLDYVHTSEHVFSRWIGLIAHAFVWFIGTLIIQARKKGE